MLFRSLFIAGCGGSDSLSRAELVKEADKICGEISKQNFKGFQAHVVKNAQAFSESAPPAKTQEVIGEGVTTVTVPVLEKATTELEDLEASSDEEEKVEVFIAALKDATKIAEANPESEKATNGLLYNEVHRKARDAGFNRCTSIP